MNFWDYVRLINFTLTLVAFVILVYKGALKLALAPEMFSWERAMNSVWCLGMLLATGVAIYSHRSGGWQVFIFTVLPVVQIVVSLTYKVKEETGYK